VDREAIAGVPAVTVPVVAQGALEAGEGVEGLGLEGGLGLDDLRAFDALEKVEQVGLDLGLVSFLPDWRGNMTANSRPRRRRMESTMARAGASW